jgi:hypothetical protein
MDYHRPLEDMQEILKDRFILESEIEDCIRSEGIHKVITVLHNFLTMMRRGSMRFGNHSFYTRESFMTPAKKSRSMKIPPSLSMKMTSRRPSYSHKKSDTYCLEIIMQHLVSTYTRLVGRKKHGFLTFIQRKLEHMIQSEQRLRERHALTEELETDDEFVYDDES